MHGNCYLKLSVKKNPTPSFAPTTSISIRRYITTIRWRFRHIFDVFVHKFHLTLWFELRPFWPCGCLWITSLTHPTHVPILASYDYPFVSYVWLNLITLPSSVTVNAHAPCHVTYHRGGGQKLSTCLKSLTPNYLFTLSLFGSYDED